jgi:DNA-directed RNA polymerase
MMDNTVELSEAATLKRFDASQDRLAKDFGFGDTAGAVGITKACIEVLAAHMSTALTEARTLGNNSEVKHFCRLIQDLEPEVVALSTLTCALGTVANDENLERHAVMSMGYAIAGECWAKGLLLADEKLSRKIDRVVRKRHGSLAYRKQAARSIATRAGYTAKHWEKKHVIVAGAWLLDQLLVALPDVFQLVDMEVGTSKALTITDGALELASAAVEQCLQRNPIFLPCTTPPKPWTDWHNGGYWDERSRLRASAVRTIHKETTAAVRGAMKTGVMKPHIDALNALQAVSWSINGPMLDVLKQCVEQGIEVKGLPSAHDVPPPTKPDVWEKMDEPAQRLWKYRAGQVKERNRSLVSNRVLLQHDFTTADLLVAGGSFWTPLNCDWRGRVYSVPHFSFQRDDRVRALFQFTDGAPIGRDGLRWLKIHVANCGDFDKISKQPLEERMDGGQLRHDQSERLQTNAGAGMGCRRQAFPFPGGMYGDNFCPRCGAYIHYAPSGQLRWELFGPTAFDCYDAGERRRSRELDCNNAPSGRLSDGSGRGGTGSVG